MDFLDDIKKETLIICNNSLKIKILNMHKLIPIKFMTMKEFIKKYYFSFDEKAILYLMKKMNIKYEVAKMYLDNLYYIEDKEYDNSKLAMLRDIKKELVNNNLLIYNEDFRRYVKNIDIIIYDRELDNFEKRMFSNLHYKIIKRKFNNYEHTVYEFKTMEEEVEYIAYSICKLIDNGIDVRKIKLTNINKDYYSTIERIFSLFNLKVNIPYTSKLSSYKIVKGFIKKYLDNTLESSLEGIDKNDPIYHELIKVINRYLIYEDKELLIYKLENTSLTSSGYDQGIEIIDYLDYIADDDEYIFMPCFNDGIVPNSYKDIDYITDNLRDYVGLFHIKELNRKLRINILNNIRDIKNLTVTYKLSDTSKSYYPSTLCSELKQEIGETDYGDSYSEVYNKIKLMKAYDNYLKFGVSASNFAVLNSNFKINYQGYKNKYTKINRDSDSLLLSYSSMQLYNKCAFRYYVAKVLKLDIYEENFSAFIGSMVHFVMEECLSKNDIDPDKYIKEFCMDRVFTKKEKFFLDKYKIIIKDLLNHVLEEKEYSLFDKAMYEKKIDINFKDKIIFTGIIDKILYHEENGKTYYALVDYKTGNEEINLKYLKYGLNMQLPIYLYLSKYLEFNNSECVGFYLQKINIKERDYRLVGYSNSDKDILSIIDKDYDNSKVIKGMKTNKDGSFSRYAKVISSDDIEDIKEETKDKIEKTINNILNNEFTINPKVIDDKNIGCDYCKFRDICNMTNRDRVIIKTEGSDMDG